jgi:hypothetical protein
LEDTASSGGDVDEGDDDMLVALSQAKHVPNRRRSQADTGAEHAKIWLAVHLTDSLTH